MRVVPDYSRMFVRGIGWIHVGARPNRPRAAARAYVLSTVRVGLYMLRACLHGNPCTQAHLASATRRLRAYVGYAFDSTLGYPGEGWGPRRCVYLETPCVLHNPNGLASDDRARSAYLRSLRAAFPVVALVETHCKPTQEALWAREWGSGQTFWSSLDAPVAQRGVALLFADTVDVADASAHHDANGRLLVVTGTLYRNHKMLFIVSYVRPLTLTPKTAILSRASPPL